MNKPTIPNEVADVIEAMRVDPQYDNSRIVSVALRTGGAVSHATTVLQTISFNALLSALVNGYEREMTEEQKHSRILRVYTDHTDGVGDFSSKNEDAIYAVGIKFTLDTLGIQIEGVNAQ
ncbi:hypothetical protein MH117_09980 [Paenibacillus sp. ACRRX]|uniref:hypothetical protein n=1 Tax=Paenibacillus sp. ACRRX TaxID=2918206 RepID=UPI001EF48E08|nr:hypothetical protein [Paenibacillus sp. ACRRX]MCG7407752.1 hypothetical protein [Paenibacillus sp. ACRRX]